LLICGQPAKNLPMLEIQTLGRIGIRLDDRPIGDTLARKTAGLLYYLAATGVVHSRVALAGLLWGEALESNARAYLRQALAELRRVVAPYLIIARRTVAIEPGAPFWLDVASFEHHFQHARRMHESPMPPADVAALAKAVELYRGDFLEAFHVRRAPAFEEWVLLTRERLRLRAIRAFYALSSHYAARRELDPAIDYTARLLELEPADEGVQRQMMSLLAHAGQRGAALHQYELCRRALRDLLGIDPDDETVALYERIRSAKEGVIANERFLQPAGKNNLPTALTPLIGRQEELTSLKARLRDPTCRLLTLMGPGGCGKTRLALAAATDLVTEQALGGDRFRDGVFLVSLEPLESVESIVPALARALGVAFHHIGDHKEQLLNYLRGRRLLLVLDGFERLVFGDSPSSPMAGQGVEGPKAAVLVTEILQTAPHVTLLITSRSRINLGCEQLLPLAGLKCPTRDGDVDMATVGAVQLFVAAVRRVQPGFEPCASDLDHIARICNKVDGCPLAILLAAGWSHILTPAEIATRLSGATAAADVRALDFLQADWVDMPERHRGMRAVFDHSWRLLSQRQRDILTACSVFRGPFSLDAAKHVSGASVQDLLALAEKSMIYRSTDGRFGFHALLRAYAAEKLREIPIAEQAAVDRFCVHYAERLSGWALALTGPRLDTALTELGLDIENVRAAWQWAARQQLTSWYDRAMDALCYFYKWRGQYREGNQACEIVVRKLSAAMGGSSVGQPDGLSTECGRRRVLSRALTWQGVFQWRLGQAERACASMARGREILHSPDQACCDTRREMAFNCWRSGRVMFDIARDQAAPLYEISLGYYRDLGDRWALANVLDDLSWVARYRGDYDAESRYATESLAVRRALGDRRGESRALRAQSCVAYLRGHVVEAERLIRESASIPLENGNQGEVADRQSGKGWVLGMVGRFQEAQALLDESVGIWRDLGITKMVTIIGIPLGFVELHLGDYARARLLIRKGLDVADEIGDRGRTGLGLFALSWVALAEGAFAEAEASLQQSLAIFQEQGQCDEIGQARALRGYSALGRSQLDQAKQHLCAAIGIGIQLRAFLPLLFAVPAVAWLAAVDGDSVRALELHSLASRYRFVAHSRWFADVVGKHIRAAAEALPDDLVCAARKRGRAQDLWETAEACLEEWKLLVPAPSVPN
jgi:DNA-binding SARP family transcriptional activator/predicted ATPase